jgi:hypothetical protein
MPFVRQKLTGLSYLESSDNQGRQYLHNAAWCSLFHTLLGHLRLVELPFVGHFQLDFCLISFKYPEIEKSPKN